ncbi:MAG TPA: hypothetical protein VHJ78_10375 [Actinomycetota bacterium]|nr:hypothetical protein [Actinomycetota bacterium]
MSVLEEMSSRPARLKTLPPDGTVLEELIGALQSEYGVPTTPQEYRLIIKTPIPEEPTDPSLEVKAAAPERPPVAGAPPADEEGGIAPARAARRRRRGRRRGGAADASGVEAEGPPAADQAES